MQIPIRKHAKASNHALSKLNVLVHRQTNSQPGKNITLDQNKCFKTSNSIDYYHMNLKNYLCDKRYVRGLAASIPLSNKECVHKRVEKHVE